MGLRYSKPTGYRVGGLQTNASRYKPNNNFINGSAQSYGPNRATPIVLTMTFSAAPANASAITAVPDGPPNSPTSNNRTFTFTWAGSPGTGIIPLVAGGGTAAQAATAAQVAMSAQLTNWTVTNPSAGVLVLTQKNPGFNTTGTGLSGATGITIAETAAALGAVLPGRGGQSFSTLAG